MGPSTKNADPISKAIDLDRVAIREVGPRDGLQLVDGVVSTAKKREWIAAQAAAGCAEIEVTSFVPADVLPQFADAEAILHAANQLDGLLPSALVLNVKGAERALAVGCRKISFVVSVSEAHSKANANCTTDEALQQFQRIMAMRAPADTQIGVVLATAFGCSLQGKVDPSRVEAVARKVAQLGAQEVSLADTIGCADPNQVSKMFASVADIRAPVAAHFHDTRGMGLANVAAALRVGVRRFDASLGGLGGCPFAPGATGNIVTEDCVNMVQQMGFETGIDLEALLRVRAKLSQWVPDTPLHGGMHRAGPLPHPGQALSQDRV